MRGKRRFGTSTNGSSTIAKSATSFESQLLRAITEHLYCMDQTTKTFQRRASFGDAVQRVQKRSKGRMFFYIIALSACVLVGKYGELLHPFENSVKRV